MPRLQLDHVVFAAATLEEGRAAVHAALGIDVPMGGRHEGMATHNRLMGLGGDCYFEIIAPIEGETPERPPLFGLAAPPAAPALVNFVLRSDDLAATLAALPADIADAVGTPLPMARGALSWTITQPADAGMPLGGAMPTLIEWPHGGDGPARLMPDCGVRLAGLTVTHPEAARIEAALTPLLDEPRIRFETTGQTRITAAFDTPAGRKSLS